MPLSFFLFSNKCFVFSSNTLTLSNPVLTKDWVFPFSSIISILYVGILSCVLKVILLILGCDFFGSGFAGSDYVGSGFAGSGLVGSGFVGSTSACSFSVCCSFIPSIISLSFASNFIAKSLIFFSVHPAALRSSNLSFRLSPIAFRQCYNNRVTSPGYSLKV